MRCAVNSRGEPVAAIVAGIELLSAEPGVTVRSYAECTPANVSGRLVWGLARRSVTGLLDFCDHYLQRKEAGRTDPVPVPKARPAVNRALLDQRLGQLASAAVRPELVLRNQTSGPILAAIDDVAWTSEATSAAQVTALQEFRDLFSSEVLAPRQQLAVSHIALLFSDLKGSTQLYEGIGDAAAIGGRDDIMAESFTARLHGLAHDQHLVRLTVVGAPPVGLGLSGLVTGGRA
jgi:hypothetical protein